MINKKNEFNKIEDSLLEIHNQLEALGVISATVCVHNEMPAILLTGGIVSASYIAENMPYTKKTNKDDVTLNTTHKGISNGCEYKCYTHEEVKSDDELMKEAIADGLTLEEFYNKMNGRK